MFFLRVWFLIPLLLVTSTIPASTQAVERTTEFEFGSTIAEAESMANSNGWKLRKIAALPNAYSVTGSGITLWFCNQNLGSIDENLFGGFKEFVDTVWALTGKHGGPETSVTHLPLLGRAISSTFKTEHGFDITVQIVDRNNEVKLWTRTTDTSICDTQ